MAANEENADEPTAENEAAPVELSLDQLSQAYAQVMREQGALPDKKEQDDEAEVDDSSDLSIDEPNDDSTGSQEDGSAQRSFSAGQRSVDDMDAQDDAGCSITPKSIVESILFVGAPDGSKLTARILASCMRDVSPKEVKKIVTELNQDYEDQQAAYRIVEENKALSLKLHPDLAEFQRQFYGKERPAKLNQAAIDVLAVVAYNQPVSRDGIEKIRGKPSGSAVSQLVKRSLLAVEQSQEKSKSQLFRTTDRFLELFGLGQLEDLPQTSTSSDLEELADF